MSRRISLTQGEYAIVDNGDYDELSQFKWHLHCGNYAGRTIKIPQRSYILMHRQILGCKKGEFTDHINGNGLDNRKENLRICTQSQNSQNRRGVQKNNTSGYTGVSYVPEIAKWEARIGYGGEQRILGYYEDPEQAAIVRDMAAWKYHGEFATYNEYK